MGLFTKKPIELGRNLPYTVSLSDKTRLIIGLGNPGNKYNLTRHNLGFMSLDKFAKDNQFISWRDDKKFKGMITEKALGSCKVILLKPQTYMNLSGEAAQTVANFYKIGLKDIAAIYDEASIPFGQIRNRVGGQSAGHNGVKSLIQHLGSDFGRIRIGIKNDKYNQIDSSNFVLTRLDKQERAILPEVLKEVGSIMTEFVYGESLPNDTRKLDIK